MQQSKDPRASETYLTWQDLLDEEDGDIAPHDLPSSSALPAELLFAAAPIALPPDVQALMVEKERLEDELAHLTGQGAPRPEDERMRRMYPVRVHTKESRIEDRRLRRHDEQQRMLKQRVLEKKLAQGRERERLELAAVQRKRRALEAALVKARAEERAAEVEEQRRRKASEQALATARAAERQLEREAEQERKEIEQSLVRARWASDREKALRRRALARGEARARQVEELDSRRVLPGTAAADKQTAQRAAPPRTVREQLEANLRLDGVRREQQARVLEARRAAQGWEEAHERQREQALARLRAARTEAANFDRRGKKRDRFEAEV